MSYEKELEKRIEEQIHIIDDMNNKISELETQSKLVYFIETQNIDPSGQELYDCVLFKNLEKAYDFLNNILKNIPKHGIGGWSTVNYRLFRSDYADECINDFWITKIKYLEITARYNTFVFQDAIMTDEFREKYGY